MGKRGRAAGDRGAAPALTRSSRSGLPAPAAGPATRRSLPMCDGKPDGMNRLIVENTTRPGSPVSPIHPSANVVLPLTHYRDARCRGAREWNSLPDNSPTAFRPSLLAPGWPFLSRWRLAGR